MMDSDDFLQNERDSLFELTGVGASHAARALSALLNREFVASAPRIRDGADYRRDERWRAAVIFEADGELTGLIAILLSAPSRNSFASLLLGEDDCSNCDTALGSALRELGNIVASHTISAIADTLGSRILLSVPLLVMDEAGYAFASLLDQRRTPHCIESELSGTDSILRARLLFVPDSKGSDALVAI
jgi:chemotaxis protein CheY-P-specific phosphatase CheC